jgi:hypothetical protein
MKILKLIKEHPVAWLTGPFWFPPAFAFGVAMGAVEFAREGC